MFYLVSFLTLLASLLIYMMDPAPVQLRRDVDTRSAEGYIVGFINQHQAARDYLNQWLGRIYFNNSYIENLKDSTISSSAESAASAWSIPAEMEDFISLQTPISSSFDSNFSIERWTLRSGVSLDPAQDSMSYLAFKDGYSQGSYLSALVCLNATNNLVPCYQYVCKDGASIVFPTVGTLCSSGQTQVGVKFANDVRPYVVTYSDNKDDPDWWDKARQPKALRYELWRRAMANRTHAAYNCGIISQAADVCTTTDGYYKKKSGGRIEGMSGSMSSGASDESRYCIHNGSRCMRLLPQGMESFLEKVVSVECSGGGGRKGKSLSGVFFCMNEIKDPYDAISEPTFHFDGIDNKVVGAKKRSTGSGQTWYATKPMGTEIAGVTWGYNGRYSSVYAADPDVEEGIQMPFNHGTSDFTLIVITHFGNSSPVNGWIIGSSNDVSGTVTLEGAYGLYYNDHQVVFYPGEIEGVNFKGYTIENDDGNAIDVMGVPHSWTIVRKSGKMSLYLDGTKVVEDKDGIDAIANNIKVVLGRNQVGIGNVRYYNKALSEKEIVKNFKVDSMRYGIQKVWK